MLINLKPRDARSESAAQIIRDLQRRVANVTGISLFMQAVQDLTIDSTVSPTQYQFMLTSPNPKSSRPGCRSSSRGCAGAVARRRRDRSAEQRAAVYVEIDRASAARFGITPATVDNALYDAFGQRIVSTIFTQSNQYRVFSNRSRASSITRSR
jgi:multidrug efflux pump